MAIDSVRLLTDSAAQLWRRLGAVRPLGQLTAEGFDEWLGAHSAALDHAEAQALRRDYKRLTNLVEEIETLVRSRPRALQLVRERAAEPDTSRGVAAH